MDLMKFKEIRTKSNSNHLYSPCIANHNCSFRNIVAIIFIVINRHMRNSFGTSKNGINRDDEKTSPKGATECQRITSLTTALIYGREGRSSKSGRRFGPTKASISAWAFFWTSGYSAIARNSACTADAV